MSSCRLYLSPSRAVARLSGRWSVQLKTSLKWKQRVEVKKKKSISSGWRQIQRTPGLPGYRSGGHSALDDAPGDQTGGGGSGVGGVQVLKENPNLEDESWSGCRCFSVTSGTILLGCLCLIGTKPYWSGQEFAEDTPQLHVRSGVLPSNFSFLDKLRSPWDGKNKRVQKIDERIYYIIKQMLFLYFNVLRCTGRPLYSSSSFCSHSTEVSSCGIYHHHHHHPLTPSSSLSVSSQSRSVWLFWQVSGQ